MTENLPAPAADDSGKFILYQTEDGQTRIEVRLSHETIWLPQRLIATLFQVSVPTVNEHLKSVFEDRELDPAGTIRKFRIVQTEGNREVSRTVDHYNLDAILAVGYRVRSHRGTQFRIWATTKCEERRGKCENGFTRAFVRFCKADRPCLSGTRPESRSRKNARTTIDSFRNVDWSQCRGRPGQPKPGRLHREVLDRLQGGTGDTLLASSSRRIRGFTRRAPCSDYARVQRVDRDSHQHCQKDTRSGPCLNFPLHTSLFKLSLPVDEHFARSLDELKTLESQAKEAKKKAAGHSEPKQKAAKKPKGKKRSDD